MELIILGKGGYEKVVSDVAWQLNRYEKISFLDDTLKDTDVLARCEDYADYIDENTEFYPAFGNNEVRLEWIKKLLLSNAQVATIIAQDAYVSPKAIIEKGCVLLNKSVVNTNSIIENGCLLNIASVVDHDSVVGEGSHICIGAVVKANNTIPPCFKLEANQVIERGEMQ